MGFDGATPYRPPAGYAPPGGGGSGPPARNDYRLYGPDKGDPPGPVTPLGKHGEVLVVMSPGGEILQLTPKSNANAFINAFDGEVSWLIDNFAKLSKEGQPLHDFNLRNCYAWFVAHCRRAGIWDGSIRTRGIGVWPGPAGEDGRARPVAHCGGRILLASEGEPDPGVRGDGEVWKAPGWRHDAFVYVARPDIAEPAMDAPASVADGRRVVDALHMWTWDAPYAPELVAGWMMAALLGGWSSWRVHCQIAAEFGSGKSTLMKLVSAVLGALGKPFNNVSEAAVRAALSNESRILLVDEAEGEGGPEGRVAKLIGLLRLMAGDEGAVVGRSSSSQQLHETRVSGCALMAAILPPPLGNADRSRIFRAELKKVTGGDAGKVGRIRAETLWAGGRSEAFRARALLHWRRFADCQELYRRAVIERARGDGRQADLLSVILAGRELLLRDEMPLPDEVDDALDLVAPLLDLMKEVDAETSTALECWHYLLAFDTPDRRGGEIQNIGSMIAFAMGEDNKDGYYTRTLPRFGLRMVRVGPAEERATEGRLRVGDDYLVVANRAPQLNRVFTGPYGQKWAGGNWSGSLKQLGEDVLPWPVPMQFAGPKCRGLAVPMRVDGKLSAYAPDVRFDSSAPPLGRELSSQEGIPWN